MAALLDLPRCLQRSGSLRGSGTNLRPPWIPREHGLAGPFSEPFALDHEIQKFWSPLGHCAADEFRQLPEPSAELPRSHGIAGRRLRDTAGVADCDRNVESVEREPAFGEKGFNHDDAVGLAEETGMARADDFGYAMPSPSPGAFGPRPTSFRFSEKNLLLAP